MKLERLAGQADIEVPLLFLDSTTGQREPGVTSATPGLALWYRREGGAKVAFSSVSDLSALTDAHTDEGLLHISDGLYRFDAPDAVGAAGVRFVEIGGTATDMVVVPVHIDLLAYDPLAVDLGALITSVANIGAVSIPETTGDPGATPTRDQVSSILFAALRNKIVVDDVAGKIQFHNNAGTVIFEASFVKGVSTYTRNQIANP